MIRDPSDGSVREPRTVVCSNCDDTGTVCENHMSLPWAEISDAMFACGCGADAPCPSCCDPIPQDGKHNIAEAFTPRHLRNYSSVIEPRTSGLQTGSAKPENIARLQRSRDWIADYRAGKIKSEGESE